MTPTADAEDLTPPGSRNGGSTTTDVVIVGAGPVGLTLANILGLHGVRTTVIEQRDKLIDFPRGVGIDDESLRAFQAIGMIDRVLPHTNPDQILRFVNAKGRLLAEIISGHEPSIDLEGLTLGEPDGRKTRSVSPASRPVVASTSVWRSYSNRRMAKYANAMRRTSGRFRPTDTSEATLKKEEPQ